MRFCRAFSISLLQQTFRTCDGDFSILYMLLFYIHLHCLTLLFLFLLTPLFTEFSVTLHCKSSQLEASRTTSAANLRLSKYLLFKQIPLFFQLNFLNRSSRVKVNSFGEIVSPCHTPLLISMLSVFYPSSTCTALYLESFDVDQSFLHNL